MYSLPRAIVKPFQWGNSYVVREASLPTIASGTRMVLSGLSPEMLAILHAALSDIRGECPYGTQSCVAKAGQPLTFSMALLAFVRQSGTEAGPLRCVQIFV